MDGAGNTPYVSTPLGTPRNGVPFMSLQVVIIPLCLLATQNRLVGHISVRVAVLYGARNLEMSIRFSLKSRPSERFHRPEMSQIKAEISLHTNVKLNFHKNVGCQ